MDVSKATLQLSMILSLPCLSYCTTVEQLGTPKPPSDICTEQERGLTVSAEYRGKKQSLLINLAEWNVTWLSYPRGPSSSC